MKEKFKEQQLQLEQKFQEQLQDLKMTNNNNINNDNSFLQVYFF